MCQNFTKEASVNYAMSKQISLSQIMLPEEAKSSKNEDMSTVNDMVTDAIENELSEEQQLMQKQENSNNSR